LGIDESAHGAQQAVDAVDRREDQLLDPLTEGERRFDLPVGARDRGAVGVGGVLTGRDEQGPVCSDKIPP
jgi:hypothetical protein